MNERATDPSNVIFSTNPAADKGSLTKLTRVRVLRGFCSYQSRVEAGANDTSLLRDYLPGAVVDLEEFLVLGELGIGRVVRVDPSTPLTDGVQPDTVGPADEDARDAAALARAKR